MSQPPIATRTPLEQLRQVLASGAIDQATYDLLAPSAMQVGDPAAGAIAAGTAATAVGAGGVAIGGDNSGTVNLGLLIQHGSRPGAGPADLERAYLARILERVNQVQLADKVRLSAVYTALLTRRGEQDPPGDLGSPRRGRSPEEGERRLSAVDVLDAEDRLVLLGGPGSGKSTFARIVALSMAGERLGLPDPNLATLIAPLPGEQGDDEPSHPQTWQHGPLLPVPVELRELASQLPPPGTPANAETLWDHLCISLRQAALEDFAPHLRRTLHRHGGLILLAGLDEVPEARERRVQIKQAVQDFAATFCRFLSEQWRGVLPPGWGVTLPSEAEWEKAARGGERLPSERRWATFRQVREAITGLSGQAEHANPLPGRTYPWGDDFDADKANVESMIGATSAAGCFPAGRGPYGGEEMAGNVLEWTRSLWGRTWSKADFPYPYDPGDPECEALDASDEMWRVVRGGSWGYPRVVARCADRDWDPPGYRAADLGFRMVLRAAPVS